MIRRFERTAYVTMPHATFALIVAGGMVVETPPIARWTIGKELAKVIGYYRGRYPEMEWRSSYDSPF